MKKVIYTIVFLFLVNLSANAYVDSRYTTSEQYLINNGYSKEAARIIQVQKKDLYAPIDEQKDKRTIYDKVLNYIDPLTNGNKDFPHHDINYDRSNWQDL